MTKYDKEFQSNTPEFEEARKPLEEETREQPHPRGLENAEARKDEDRSEKE